MKVHELLSDPAHWTKGVCARDATGLEVGVESPNAAAWCVHGALWLVYPDHGPRMEVIEKIEREIEPRTISWFNDTNDHSTVLSLLRRLDI